MLRRVMLRLAVRADHAGRFAVARFLQ